MAKRIGFSPLILLGDSDDYDLDGTEGTQNDYMQWWYDNEFSIEAWRAYNGDTPFQPPFP